MLEMTERAKEARRAYKRDWYARNAAHVRNYQRTWRRENQAKVKAADARYWERKAEEPEQKAR